MPTRLVRRFTRSEIAVHWTLAASVLAMILTGLALGVNVWHGVAFPLHIGSLFLLAGGVALAALAGDRKALRGTARQLRRIDRDDRRWLRGRHAPQGRFNAGQKLNAILTVAFALLFALSGFFLWLGERDHRFILAGTGTVHDLLTLFSVLLLTGHLYLALIHPSTRHALRGMTLGDVDEDWARRHHRKWVDAEQSTTAP